MTKTPEMALTNPSAAQPVLSLSEAIDPNSEAWADAAQRIQGNIVQPHGRKCSALLAFKIAGISSRREIGRLALRWVTSAREQETRQRRRRERRSLDGTYCDPKVFGFLYLSASGYRKLGFGDDQLGSAFPDPAQLKDNWFIAGLVKKQGEIKFPDPSLVDIEDCYEGGIDALLVLASDHADVLKGAVEDALLGIEKIGTLLCIEQGQVRRNEHGQPIEPFGFPDSISRPEVFKTAPDPVFPSNLLMRDSLAKDPNAFGSYLVYCKLEQDVTAFEAAVKAFSKEVNVTEDRAGGMLIGRFKDGTPLTDHDHPLGAHAAAAPNYLEDLDGTKCPFQAHIRKVNPRIDARQGKVVMPLFRRGVPYGPVERANGNGSPASEGLLFLAFQDDIAGRFGAILLTWVNSKIFPIKGTGTDAMMGNVCDAQDWPCRPHEIVKYSIQRFIKMKGGEFFFAPSLPFLESMLSY